MAFYGAFPRVCAGCDECQTSQVVVDFGLAEARAMVPRESDPRGGSIQLDAGILPESCGHNPGKETCLTLDIIGPFWILDKPLSPLSVKPAMRRFQPCDNRSLLDPLTGVMSCHNLS